MLEEWNVPSNLLQSLCRTSGCSIPGVVQEGYCQQDQPSCLKKVAMWTLLLRLLTADELPILPGKYLHDGRNTYLCYYVPQLQKGLRVRSPLFVPEGFAGFCVSAICTKRLGESGREELCPLCTYLVVFLL